MKEKQSDFIIIPRKVFNDGVFGKPEPYTKREAFLDLVQMAAYEEKETSINGVKYKTKRGEIIASKSFLCKKWGWKVDKVRRYLDYLQRNEWCYYSCDHQSYQPITLISIVNYDSYQGITTTPATMDDSISATTSATTDATQLNKNNNNNKNNIKKSSNDDAEKRKRFVPPTIDDVRDYCQESNYPIDADSFVNYYQSKGWMIGKSPMKDWKAAVRTWVSKRKEPQPQPQLFSQEQPPQEEPKPKRTISISFINSYYKKAWMDDEQWQREFENTIKAHKDAGYEIIYDE